MVPGRYGPTYPTSGTYVFNVKDEEYFGDCSAEPVGSKIDVEYLVDDPGVSRAKNPFHILGAIGVLLVGGIILWIGILQWRELRRSKSAEQAKHTKRRKQ